ncbi:hypothetical protein GCM10010302_17540 [Streptomyces polychromogenes]|uniref:Uncharacterized protein n=1 Tax=Streptomyces polychromogenes TaxID=67342 RepID=A0ABP3EY96_9ACTN
MAKLVNFRCLGEVPGNKFLDGNTGTNKVALAPSTAPPFTGTLWSLQEVPSVPHAFTIECMGTGAGSQGSQFLDGNTSTGEVTLRPNTNFTGTRWLLSNRPDGSHTLTCLGDQEGVRILDGITQAGKVHLVDTVVGKSGTAWALEVPA